MTAFCHFGTKSFQSLSGLSLGLNCFFRFLRGRYRAVSIPFRAVTGFELQDLLTRGVVPAEFQSLSGLSLGLNTANRWLLEAAVEVSIPFRAVTGFEPSVGGGSRIAEGVSIPFRAVTGFEQPCVELLTLLFLQFQSLSGLSLGLNCLPFFPCKINELDTHFREPICFRLFFSPIQRAPRKIKTGNAL